MSAPVERGVERGDERALPARAGHEPGQQGDGPAPVAGQAAGGQPGGGVAVAPHDGAGEAPDRVEAAPQLDAPPQPGASEGDGDAVVDAHQVPTPPQVAAAGPTQSLDEQKRSTSALSSTSWS